MLDPAYIRDHVEVVRTGLRNRGLDSDKALEEIATLETARRRIIPELEGLRRQQNASGDQIAQAKRQGKDATAIQEANKARTVQIKQLGCQLDSIEYQRTSAGMVLPNLPQASVPVGKSADDNVEVRRHGEPRTFDFQPQPHWDLGPALGIIDFERGAKLAGARFTVLSGAGARLSRALINFMLDLHTREHGYREVEPPFLVNSAALTGTGQLPRFEQDLFKMAGEPEDLSRDLFVQQHGSVPGEACEHQVSRGRHGQSGVRARAQRIRTRGRPHAHRDSGELSGKGRQRHDPDGASSVHGWKGTYQQIAI